jgi:ParB-like chromosome segregation protein Spo0J
VKQSQEDVESWAVSDIRPYENNAKIHSEDQVASIAKSIERFGFDQPIVVDGAGVIIKGHGRHLAAQKLGMERVPVIVRKDLTANEANASRLADNRVAQGDVDTNMLHEELEKIASLDEDLIESMGFSEKELDFMISDLSEMDESMLFDASAGESSEVVSDAISDSEKVASKRIPAKDVFGFTHLTGEQAKVIARWLNVLQGTYESGTPADALYSHAQEVLQAKITE